LFATVRFRTAQAGALEEHQANWGIALEDKGSLPVAGGEYLVHDEVPEIPAAQLHHLAIAK
jgi:hypothetical protein